MTALPWPNPDTGLPHRVRDIGPSEAHCDGCGDAPVSPVYAAQELCDCCGDEASALAYELGITRAYRDGADVRDRTGLPPVSLHNRDQSMDSTTSHTVVVSDDAVILTREQAQVVLDVLGMTTDGPAAQVYDAIVEQVGP